MEIIESPREMQKWSERARNRGETIAFVPTMGFLHEGHISLMREGRRRASLLASSLFVNPTQFGPNEDFGRYPRNFDGDCAMMRTVPVDVLFAPQPEAMYPPGSQTWVEATEITRGLCGAQRPGHFRGVTTVVAKLFNIVKPHVALFGEKDYQQLRAIERMVRDLNFDLEIVAAPTVREPDGLAMSSRNAYLSPDERRKALSLSCALRAAGAAFREGARRPRDLVAAAGRVLESTPGVQVEYVDAVDAATLEPIDSIERPVVVAIAARVGNTRLIDNMVINP
ncbi:MAG TPA: pantoate--beta-alanine ligase [Candidatus Binataceae bacterium]|jgi:pantoate--beta-alanine ligase|nr:pantoate--beta-alanine ligase [Candidatus Binataceae bacterium]